MATLALWALATGARRASREDSSPKHKGHKESRTKSADPCLRTIVPDLLWCSARPSVVELSHDVLLPQLIQVAFAVRSHVPRIGPEAQVNTPPIVGYVGLHQLRDELVEVQLAGAEGVVRAGVVFVQRAVRIDQVD